MATYPGATPAYVELAAALDRREAAYASIRASFDLEHPGSQSDELADASCDAIRVVERYPVTTLDDLIVKLGVITGELGDEIDGDELLTDLLRIREGQVP